VTEGWSTALRFLPTEKVEISNAKALRNSASDLRASASKGQYSDIDLTEFWALVQAAGPTLRASNPELGARAGLGRGFFTTVVRDRRRPKLESFLSALTAIIEVANERLHDVDHPTAGAEADAGRELPPQILQTFILANYLANVAKDEIAALDAELPNDIDAAERNKKLREILTLFADGLERIASALQDAISKPRERRLLLRAKEAVEELGRDVSNWIAKNKADVVDCGMRLQLIAAGVALLGTAGAEMTVATTAVAAMVGGPRVIEAFKRG
jgi:hypothetical protein